MYAERERESRLGRQTRTADRKSTPRGFQRHRIGRRLQEVEEKEVVAEEATGAEEEVVEAEEVEGEVGGEVGVEGKVGGEVGAEEAELSKVAGRKMKLHCLAECIQGMGCHRGVCASTFYNIFRVISMQNQRP